MTTQSWRLPRKDLSVREMLVARGYLSGVEAEQKIAMEAMTSFLASVGMEAATTYNLCVWQCLQETTVKVDPNTRKLYTAGS